MTPAVWFLSLGAGRHQSAIRLLPECFSLPFFILLVLVLVLEGQQIEDENEGEHEEQEQGALLLMSTQE